MENGAEPGLGQQIAGALAWWREAGVDHDFVAEPRSWLPPPVSGPEPSPTAKDPPEGTETANLRSPLPADLDAFRAWWLSDPALDEADPSQRVPHRGSVGAPIMVLVASPEAEDCERLLSGSQGQLLDAMLSALGWPSDQAYVASVLPRYDVLPDWPALARSGLGKIALHHLSLAAPERLLVLGDGVLSLLGHDPANKPAFLPDINHPGRNFPVLAEMDLAALLARPRLKAGLWSRLLDWTGN